MQTVRRPAEVQLLGDRHEVAQDPQLRCVGHRSTVSRGHPVHQSPPIALDYRSMATWYWTSAGCPRCDGKRPARSEQGPATSQFPPERNHHERDPIAPPGEGWAAAFTEASNGDAEIQAHGRYFTCSYLLDGTDRSYVIEVESGQVTRVTVDPGPLDVPYQF